MFCCEPCQIENLGAEFFGELVVVFRNIRCKKGPKTAIVIKRLNIGGIGQLLILGGFMKAVRNSGDCLVFCAAWRPDWRGGILVGRSGHLKSVHVVSFR